MGQHRYAALGEKSHRIGHLYAAFQFDRLATGFRHDPCGGPERLLGRFLIAPEGQIDDDAALLGRPDDGLAVRDHHVDGDAERGVHAVDHHAHGIADEQEIHVRVQQFGDRRRIGGQRDDRFAVLAGAKLGNGDTSLTLGRSHIDRSLDVLIASQHAMQGHVLRRYCVIAQSPGRDNCCSAKN